MESQKVKVAEESDGIGLRSAKLLYPLFAGQVFQFIFTAITFIIVTRLLGPADYGVYIFAFGFSTLINAVAAFGVGAYFNADLAKRAVNKDAAGMRKTLSSGYVIIILLGLFLTFLGIGLSGWIAGFFSNIGVTPLTLILSSGQIVFLMIAMIATNGLIGLSRGGLSSILNVAIDIVQLVLSVVLTIMFGVDGAIAAMLIGYAFGAVLGTLMLFKAASRHGKIGLMLPKKADIMEVLNFSWPIGANNFLNTGMSSFSILFLGFFVSAAALGNYGAASKGIALMALIYGTFGSGLLSIFATTRALNEDGEDANQIYGKIIVFSLLFTLPMIMYIGILSVPGLYLLISSSFTAAPGYLTLIALGTMIGLFGSYMSSLLISSRNTKSVLFVNLVSAVAQLAFLLVLVPYAGTVNQNWAVIAAIVTIFFIGNVIEAWLFAREGRLKMNLKLNYGEIIRTYACSILLGLFLVAWYVISNNFYYLGMPELQYAVQLGVGLALTLVLYPVVLIALGAVQLNDIVLMRKIAKKLGKMGMLMNSMLDYSERIYKSLGKG